MEKKLSKRELIEPNPDDKRYIRRDTKGRFVKSVNVHKSLSVDDQRKAKHIAKEGQGDRGDRKTKAKSK